jgi:DNA-binding MarR family transcriptional regulator
MAMDAAVSAQQQAWKLVLGVFLEQRSRMLGAAQEFGLAPQQAFAILRLKTDEPTTMTELAQALKCDNSNVTGIADRLEAAGLAERRAHPSDRRVKTLVLTDKGAEVRGLYQDRLGHTPPAFEAMSDEDAKTLVEILERATP